MPLSDDYWVSNESNIIEKPYKIIYKDIFLEKKCITIIVTKARKRTIEDDNIYVSDFKVVLGLTICAELTNKPKPK